MIIQHLKGKLSVKLITPLFYFLSYGYLMSKALPIVVAAVIGGAAMVPVYMASKDPARFQASSHSATFNPESASAVEKISYVLGYEVTSQMTPPELDVNAFSAGAKAGHSKETFPMTEDEVKAAYQEFIASQQNAAIPAEQAVTQMPAPDASADVAFLKDNGSKPNVKTTASGLQYTVDKEGSGKQPKATDTVRVHYEGKLLNDQIFDSSFARGEPVEFGLNQVIPGWTEGLQLMKEGAVYTFYIPSELGYGVQGKGPIPPNSTLIFKVQLIKVM